MQNKTFSIILLYTLLLSWNREIKSEATIGVSSITNTTVTALSCGLVKKNAQNMLERAYEGCGNGIKTCYGDKDGCVDTKSCARMSALIFTTTEFQVEFYSKCALDLRPGRWGDYFFGAAVNDTVQIQEDGQITCNNPTREDFRLFHFWPRKQKKCDTRSENYALEIIASDLMTWENWKIKCEDKYKGNEGELNIPSDFNLTHWIENYQVVQHSSGSFVSMNASAIEGNVDYEVVDGISCISVPYDNADGTTNKPPQSTTSGSGPRGYPYLASTALLSIFILCSKANCYCLTSLF